MQYVRYTVITIGWRHLLTNCQYTYQWCHLLINKCINLTRSRHGCIDKRTFFLHSSSSLSFHQLHVSHQIVPSQCLIQPMAMQVAVARYWIEQAVFIMGQTSRCCMVCLMPVTISWVVWIAPLWQIHSWPAKLCTQTVECLPGCPGMLSASWEVFVSTDVLCTLSSRGSSRSLHASSFSFRCRVDGLSAFEKTLLPVMSLVPSMIGWSPAISGTISKCIITFVGAKRILKDLMMILLQMIIGVWGQSSAT